MTRRKATAIALTSLGTAIMIAVSTTPANATFGQWTAYPGAGYTGFRTDVAAITDVCVSTPSSDVNSAVNGADSGFTLELYSDSSCGGSPVATLPPGTAKTWATSAISYRAVT